MNPAFPRVALALIFAVSACRETPVEPEAAASALAEAVSNWIARAKMPSDRIGVATAVVADAQGRTTLFAIGGKSPTSTAPVGSGGLSTVEAYNSATDTWARRAKLPFVLQRTNGAVEINGKIYVSGGYKGYNNISEEFLMYDPGTNTWTRKQPMPRTTYDGVSAVIDDKLYVLTGCNQQEACFPYVFPDVSFYRYDPALDRWTELPLPPSGRQRSGGVAGTIGKKFYVVGGGSNVLEVYNPATNTWTTRSSMGSIRHGAAGAAVGGKLYVIAGTIPDPNYTPGCGCSVSIDVPTTSVYDPATNAWRNLAPAPFRGAGRAGGRVVVNGQVRVAVVGGARPNNNYQYVP